MQTLLDVIDLAQREFAQLLDSAMRIKPLDIRQYQRYLSMQYHLTRGVQAYFMCAAAHADFAGRKPLRRFLCDLANEEEEEQHCLVAAADLARMELPLLAEPLDVTLWHAHFRAVVADWPFLRLGAACVLENLSDGAARDATRTALRAPFLSAENTKFVMLHLHEVPPRGEQIVAALAAARLDEAQIEDLVTGAKQGMVLYLRMMEWVLFPSTLAAGLDRSRDPRRGYAYEPVSAEVARAGLAP
jgi:hypothetical protein